MKGGIVSWRHGRLLPVRAHIVAIDPDFIERSSSQFYNSPENKCNEIRD